MYCCPSPTFGTNVRSTKKAGSGTDRSQQVTAPQREKLFQQIRQSPHKAEYHHPVPHIDATIGDSPRVIGSLKKTKSPGRGELGAGADVVEPLGPQPPTFHAGMIDYPRTKRTVQRTWRGTPSHIIGINEVYSRPRRASPRMFSSSRYPPALVPYRRVGVFPQHRTAGKVGAVPQP